MIRTISFIFLFAAAYVTALAEVSSPFEAIRTHRKWMTRHTPAPETLSEEQLMLHALQIIDLRMQEPEAERILVAAATKVPEVEAYVNWMSTLDCDTLFQRKRNALKGMSKYLDSKHPGCYASRKIKTEWLIIENIFRNIDNDIESLIKEQEKVCRKNPSKQEKALLLSMKFTRFDNRNSVEETDNPLHYPEIWQLEREVLDLYPIASTDTVADRMYLYSQLADLKSLPQNDLTVRLMLGDDANPYNNETLYDYTGSFRDYPCNSGFYLQKAIQISTALYGEFHPATVALCYAYTAFNSYNITVDQDMVDSARNLNDIISMYYPRRSSEGKLTRLLKAWTDYQFTANANLPDSECEEILNICRLTYGDSSTYYLNQLSQITSFAIFTKPDYTKSLDFFETECKRICPDVLSHTLWLLYAYSSVKFVDAQEGIRRMNILKENYLNSHDGTPLSVKVGEDLAGFFRNMAFNFGTASEIYDTLSSDIEKLYGKYSAMCFIHKNDIFTMNAKGVDKEEVSILDNLISEAESHSFTSKAITLNNLRQSKADYFWGMGIYDKAHETYKELLSDPKMTYRPQMKVRDAISRILSGKEKDGAETLVKETRSGVDTIPRLEVSPQLLLEMAYYYNLTNQLTDAVAMLEQALEAHEQQTNYALDDEYFKISGFLAELYEATNNRTAASRLIAADRKSMSNSFAIGPSYALVEYLLKGFYRAFSHQDWNAMSFYLGSATKAVQDMNATSGASDDLKYTAVIQYFQAITSFYTLLNNQFQQNKEYFESDEFKSFNVDMKQMMNQSYSWLPQFKQEMLGLEEGFPNYDPNYKTNSYYRILLSSLGAFYQSCEPDYPKAEEYLLKGLELSSDPVERKNVLFNLAGLMQTAGDSVKNDKYLQQAYGIISQYPERMSDTDRIGETAYRFNKYVRDNNLPAATASARKIYTDNRRILDGNFQLMSSAEQEQVFNTFGDPAWALAALLEKDPANLAGEVFDAIVYRTGLQLRSQQETNRIISQSDNPDVRLLADSIASLRTLQKRINITPDKWMTQESTEASKKNSDLSFAIEHMEMQLLDLTAKERADAHHDITWQMVRDALKPSQAAVEFLFSASHVMALVLTSDADSPVPVTLCSWQELAGGLNALKAKNSATLAKRLYRKDSPINLYSMLWQPLESALGNARTVYFNAPGILHTIAFNAIETPDGNYLIDKYDLRQLTTTAQITFPSDEQAPKTAGLLGDVIFDPSQIKDAGTIPQVTGERAVEDDFALDDFDNRGVARQYFRYLPFTGIEINQISNVFGSLPVKIAKRENATEQEFRDLCAGSPEVLHLATHGFFLSSEKEAMHVPFMKRFLNSIGSPMQRSGIALANAEATWKGSEAMPENNDGILTAAEVSALNLKNTRLVALSACETALGGYNFEGIHGLTRGFKQAGVKSLLVSLWSVNDRSTATFMTAFYRQWIKSGDRHAAYRNAVAAVRSEYPSPFYWAPFILLD